MLDYDSHAKYQLYVAELNSLYLRTPALWENDVSWEGFRWIDADNSEESILSFRRIDKSGNELVVVLNFTPVVREEFVLGVAESGIYEEIFNSDSERFGGSGVINAGDIETLGASHNYQSDSLKLRVPPLGVSILRRKKLKNKIPEKGKNKNQTV